MYLMKTADAISTLQNIHRQNSLNNSPQSPSSPKHKLSPMHSIKSPLRAPIAHIEVDEYSPIRYKNLHQRNASLDGSEVKPKLRLERQGMSNSYNNEGLNQFLDMNKTHTRHHSYEGMTRKLIDQTNENAATRQNSLLMRQQQHQHQQGLSNSPIKRSNSFSKKNFQPKMNANNQNTIKKSASSTSFRRMIGGIGYETDDVIEYYINNDDDLIDDHRYNHLNSSDSESSGIEMESKDPPITNTRCNKTFLMRLEQNKKLAAGVSSGGGNQTGKQGVIACPNTPEFRRRDNSNVRQSFRERASMPRDSSLSRMKQDLPNLNSTKKSLTNKEKVQPKYLDISKYKPVQGNNFLKRDESKSYLAHKEVKRSPSAASVNLNRNDATRTSNRSVKSAGAKPSQSQIGMKKKKISHQVNCYIFLYFSSTKSKRSGISNVETTSEL